MRLDVVGRVSNDMIDLRECRQYLPAIPEIQRRVPDVLNSIQTTLVTLTAILSLSLLQRRTCPRR